MQWDKICWGGCNQTCEDTQWAALTDCFQAFHFPRCAQIVPSQQDECKNDKHHWNENVIVCHSRDNHYGKKLQHDLRRKHNITSFCEHNVATEQPTMYNHTKSSENLEVWSERRNSDLVKLESLSLALSEMDLKNLLWDSRRRCWAGCHLEIQRLWKNDWEFVLV